MAANETLEPMSRTWRLLLTGLWFAFLCSAQQNGSATDVKAIRSVVERFMDAARRGDTAEMLTVAGNGRQSTPGGSVQVDLGDRVPSWKHRSNMIRRVEILNPNTGVAIGVWKDFDATPPFDTGTFHYTLIREGGVWKVRYAHEAFLPPPQTVSSLIGPRQTEKKAGEDGWERLFDGKTLKGWLGTDLGQDIRKSWRIEDGCLVAVANGPRSSLLTRRQYLFFDLRFEWMGVARTNSGVKYRLLGFDRILGGSREALGLEYQIADDDGDPGARIDPKQRSGSLYSVTAVERSNTKAVGQWNEARIVVTAQGVKHWLNGTLTADYPTDIPFASAIVLQHHTTEVRFRNIRIRPL